MDGVSGSSLTAKFGLDITYGGAQVGVSSSLPLILQIFSLNTLKTHVGHATCSDVEAGGDGDHVELVMLAIGGLDASLGEFGNAVARLE